MKHVYKAIALSLFLMPFCMAAQAAEHDMAGMKGMEGMHGDMKGMPGMGMHGDMMNPEHLKEMQAHMLVMHDLSNKILAEKDPKKQQALKDQQLEVMKAHMKARMEKHHKMEMSHPAPPPAPAPEVKK